MNDRFAHHLRLDQLRDGDRLDLTADEAERREIAKRLDLSALGRLDAHVMLTVTGEVVRAQGRLLAALEQSCCVTREPVAAHVDDPFDVMFMPEPPPAAPDEEIELAAADCDVVFYEGGAIDLGTAIADTLALSLNPYPRSAGADAALREAGVISEAEASPFAILAKLRSSDES